MLAALTLSLVASAANSGEARYLHFEGVAERYDLSKPFTFSISSTAGKDVLFYCTAEWRNQGRWEEVDYSIDQPKSTKLIKLIRLKSSSRQEIAWNTAPQKIGSGGPFRLKAVVYELKGHKPVETVFSQEFFAN